MNHDDLTNNLHSFSLNTENDNHRYKASANHNDTQANLLAAINNIANWEKDSDNATPFLVPSAAFTVIGGDSDPPVVNSITPSGSPSSTATSVDFTVTFDEDATDVTTDDFELTTTGSAAGSLSAVSGTGTSSITVTVSTITGAGTIRLDLKSNTNIIDGSGNGNNNNGYVTTFIAGTAHSVDNQPTVTLSATNVALSESTTGTLGTITAILSHSYTADVTVTLSTSGATSGSDFNLSRGSIVISSGTSGSATITIIDDSVVEGTETLMVSITSVTNGTESGSQSKDFTITNNDFSFDLKVFLEGTLSGGTMSTTLSAQLPTAQPYSGATAETSSGIPASAVDWIEVELRTGSTSGTKTGTNRAGILKNDGTVVDKDGNTFTMSQASGTDYFIVIRHRNHLSVMSASAISATNGVYSHDFTTAQTQTFNNGSDGAKQIGSVFAMLAGDADGDGDIDTTDLTTWRGQNGTVFSYNSTNGDFNLDGVINAVDRIEFQKKNASRTSQVPST